jgi:hypothetical protein
MPQSQAADSSSAASDVVDHGHDDEDAVGPPGAGFGDLVGVEHEVLAQHRQAGGGARRQQVFGLALEGGFIGENRQAGGAAGS